MLESIRGLHGWCHKDCRMIYRLWRQRIIRQDESDGDSEFIVTIGLGGKSISYWKIDKRKFWKWRGIWKVYKNPISKFDVGQMSFENKRKACRAHAISTTKKWYNELYVLGSLKKA